MIQRRRPQAQPIPEFVTMLQQYEITCRGPSLPTPSTTLITAEDKGFAVARIESVESSHNNDESKYNSNVEDDDQRNVTATASSTSDANTKKRSMAVSSTGSNRMVGPQRPALPPSILASAAACTTITDSDVGGDGKLRKPHVMVGPQRLPLPSNIPATTDDDDGNAKRRKSIVMVGPQRPPPSTIPAPTDDDVKRRKRNVIVGPQRPAST